MNNKDSDLKNSPAAEDSSERNNTIAALKEQGFGEDIIIEAIEKSGCTTLEVVLLYIDKLQEAENIRKARQRERAEAAERNRRENEEKLRIIREQQENKLRDELYLEKLREQIKCDMEERNLSQIRYDSVRAFKTDVSKNKVSENECRVKVRQMWDGRSFFVYLDKNQTVSRLFDLIKERLNMKNLVFYTTMSQSQIFETDETLEAAGYFPSATIVVNK